MLTNRQRNRKCTFASAALALAEIRHKQTERFCCHLTGLVNICVKTAGDGLYIFFGDFVNLKAQIEFNRIKQVVGAGVSKVLFGTDPLAKAM